VTRVCIEKGLFLDGLSPNHLMIFRWLTASTKLSRVLGCWSGCHRQSTRRVSKRRHSICDITSAQNVTDQRLGYQHLTAAQHAAPSAVAAVIRAVQNWKFASVGQPESADEVFFETVEAFVVAGHDLKLFCSNKRRRRSLILSSQYFGSNYLALALEGRDVGP
jgi:hypothetical protein